MPAVNAILDTNLFNSTPIIYNHKTHFEKQWPFFIEKTFNNKILTSATYKEPGNWDIFLTKLNTNLEKDSVYNGTFEYDYLCPFPVNSGYIYLDDCFPVGVDDEIPTPQEYYSYIATIPIKIYPNPASNIIHFALKNTEHHSNITLQVYDIYGKLIHEQNIITGQQEAVADVSSWKSGMYAVVVSSNNKLTGNSTFIVK